MTPASSIPSFGPGSRVRRGAALAAGAVLLVTLAACGSGSDPAGAKAAGTAISPSSSMTSTEGATITISDFDFSVPATVAAGATVTVQNDDGTAHTVTASGAGGFDVTVQGGKSGTFTAPSKPGSYPFVCTFHGNMKGVLKVT